MCTILRNGNNYVCTKKYKNKWFGISMIYDILSKIHFKIIQYGLILLPLYFNSYENKPFSYGQSEKSAIFFIITRFFILIVSNC